MTQQNFWKWIPNVLKRVYNGIRRDPYNQKLVLCLLEFISGSFILAIMLSEIAPIHWLLIIPSVIPGLLLILHGFFLLEQVAITEIEPNSSEEEF